MATIMKKKGKRHKGSTKSSSFPFETLTAKQFDKFTENLTTFKFIGIMGEDDTHMYTIEEDGIRAVQAGYCSGPGPTEGKLIQLAPPKLQFVSNKFGEEADDDYPNSIKQLIQTLRKNGAEPTYHPKESGYIAFWFDISVGRAHAVYALYIEEYGRLNPEIHAKRVSPGIAESIHRIDGVLFNILKDCCVPVLDQETGRRRTLND